MRTLNAVAALTALVITSATAAQGYPDKTVRLVVPTPPGGTLDTTARLLATSLGARWGQAVVVENRAGAGGTIGSDLVAKAPADGYTLLLSAAAQHTVNQWLYAALPFDPIKSFAPIAMVGRTPMVLAVGATSAVKTVAQYVSLAKAQPGKLTYSSAGIGTYNHLAGESFAMAAGIKLVHVPYKGVAPALADVAGGHIHSTVGTVPSIQPFLSQGTLRALAVTTAQRSKALPDVPTLAESGLAGYDIAVRFALFAPVATPAPVIARIHKDLGDTLKSKDIENALTKLGVEIEFSSPEALRRAIEEEAGKWGATINRLGIKMN